MTEDPFHLLKPNEVELARGLCYQVEDLKIEIAVGQQRPWGTAQSHSKEAVEPTQERKLKWWTRSETYVP